MMPQWRHLCVPTVNGRVILIALLTMHTSLVYIKNIQVAEGALDFLNFCHVTRISRVNFANHTEKRNIV